MPSPFPGMDPYIEFAGSWTDFHSDLLVGLREQINQRLPNHYVRGLKSGRRSWLTPASVGRLSFRTNCRRSKPCP